MEKTRVDKWLWAVRIYKSRTMAADACKNGKVKLNDTILKPSSMVSKRDIIFVRKDHFNLSFKIVEIIDKRVSAKLAEPCYENITPLEELNKFKNWFLTGRPNEFRDKGMGRPTKRDRRNIDEHKSDFDEEDLEKSDDVTEFFNFDE
jgi:ribosome-associated heat shock protein Hsp15